MINFIGWGIVKCSQTGELHTVSSENLLTEQLEPVEQSHLKPGASLMMEQDNKKIYPVTYVKGLCVCGRVYVHARVCVRVHVCVCMHTCVHACVHACTSETSLQ